MVQIGDNAPDFTGQDARNGQPFKLSDHFGKVIVLAFVGWT
jgi:peroxiredoxin